MAGGRGTRFWPRSRRKSAKQVLRFFGEHSLIQQTVNRLRPVIPPERIWVLTNDHLKDEIAAQLSGVPRRQILAEPAQRNTAPAIGLAAHILASVDPDAVMGVFPSDHVIGRPDDYVRLVKPAFEAARRGKIAVLGIQPRWAETGYGYIEFPRGIEAGNPQPSPVRSFREKPKRPEAERFVRAGNFYWNAGMFFWRASVLLQALREHRPKIASLLATLPPFESRQFTARLGEVFPLCEDVSVDYAVMEPAAKAGQVVGLAAGDIGWNDVGSWNAVYELYDKDRDGNAGRGELLIEKSKRVYVDADGKLVALLGVKDLIVVDTPDALLIAHRTRAQEIGKLVKRLEKSPREDLL
ncbi:MAG: mannose-1-phosphate guanylyltransferase [Bryobacterales bacterium]|nr:mannose-1-phosphate guanylyltransferase [Bryobacterales bacterium]MBV9399643.1 mannose-1-phosphate guanylyltransferase [Bryobacterales bacterium]